MRTSSASATYGRSSTTGARATARSSTASGSTAAARCATATCSPSAARGSRSSRRSTGGDAQHGGRGARRAAGAQPRPAPRPRRALPAVRGDALRRAAVEPRAGRRAVRQRRDGEVPPPRAVRGVRRRRPAAAPQARRARAARAGGGRRGPCGPARPRLGGARTTPVAAAAAAARCGTVGGMGLTGNWDGRISRRTLLRTSGSATAAYVLLGRSALSAAAPPFAGNPFALGVASGDPTPERRRAVDAAGARSARRRRHVRRRVRRALRGRRRRGLPADRPPRRGRRAPRRGAHGPRRARRPASPTPLLVPVQVGPDHEPGRPHPHRPAARLDRGDDVRVRVLPELHERVLRRLRRPRDARRRARRAPRRLHLRGTRDRRRPRPRPRPGRRSCSRSTTTGRATPSTARTWTCRTPTRRSRS